MDDPTEIVGYDVHRDGDTWHARRRADVTPEQGAHGVQQVVTADTFKDLELEAIAQRIRASWYA